MTIQNRQEEIIEEFGMLEGDMEMSINYVIDLGQNLEPYPSDLINDSHLVKGCQSKVWLHSELKQGKIKLKADSNTAITKGLVSLLIRVFDSQSPEDILNADIFFPEKIGMNRFIGTQRSNGFGAMIKQIKMDALAHHSQLKP
jgi:cysteine desulfuration protein SufE